MNKFVKVGAFAFTFSILPYTALAQTWSETGDAGNLISSSQNTIGTGSLTTIKGSLTPAFDFEDIYCITITDPTIFSATSSSPNTPLWLFDIAGNGVTSQEGIYLNTPSKITGSFVSNSGIYHLAISDHDILAYNSASQDIWNSNPRSVETPPNGTGAPGPLASWSPFGASLGLGNYTITLTGASYGNCSVPEPSSLAFLSGVGLPGAMMLLHRRRRKKTNSSSKFQEVL